MRIPVVHKRLPSLAATLLLCAGVMLAAATAAVASCPQEKTVQCHAFSYSAHGHRYEPSHISFALNGHPSCSHAGALIKTWLGKQTNRIYDPSSDSYWFKVGSNPLEFTAGLCGDLRFRK